jgi:hypothetical protein
MRTIAEIIGRNIVPPPYVLRDQMEFPVDAELPIRGRTARYSVYEIEVFNHLYTNKRALGIHSVTRFRNRLVDGPIVLSDGRRLVVELKLRMNWERACQAEWEFHHFLKRFDTKDRDNPIEGAIVFFEEFSGDWAERRANRATLWGWEAWHLYHRDSMAGKPMDLVRLSGETLEGFPEQTGGKAMA